MESGRSLLILEAAAIPLIATGHNGWLGLFSSVILPSVARYGLLKVLFGCLGVCWVILQGTIDFLEENNQDDLCYYMFSLAAEAVCGNSSSLSAGDVILIM